MEKLNKNGLLQMVALVASGAVAIIRNEDGSYKGLSVNDPSVKVNEVRYVKSVGGHQVVGRTVEEMQEDERKLRQFINDWSHVNVERYAKLADKMVSGQLADVMDEVENILRNEYHTVETREVTKTVEASGAHEYRGMTDSDLANYLTVDELKAVKNRANREGDLTVKNACRRALRRKGVEA